MYKAASFANAACARGVARNFFTTADLSSTGGATKRPLQTSHERHTQSPLVVEHEVANPVR
jgi:hypothetical protein